MSTFLELCQQLRQEAGISGSGPVSVTGQSGILLDVVNWVKRAYNMVQLEESRWKFLWVETSFDFVVGQRDYHPASDLGLSDFKEWDVHSFYVNRPNAQQKQPLYFMEWEPFRGYYAIQIQALPQQFSVSPSKALRFDAVPTQVETVNFEYFRKPYAFVNGNDTPVFDEQYHDIVLYKALMLYAANDEAGNIYQDAAANYAKKLAELRMQELDRPFVDMPPLA